MRKRIRKKQLKLIGGFTIIEIMIVLAIAGVIILIVFLAIPAMQRAERNHERKDAVSYVYTQIQEYYDTHDTYPLTATDNQNCNLVQKCRKFLQSVTTNTPDSAIKVIYENNGTSHEYPFDSSGDFINGDSDYDTVVIFPAHRCNRTPGLKPGDIDYPVHSINAADNNFNRWAVYIPLEPDKTIFCLDDIN